MNCPDCKEPLQIGTYRCACGWRGAPPRVYENAARVDPMAPENIEGRQRCQAAFKQVAGASDKRAWLDRLRERQQAGEILMPAQAELLRRVGQ